MLCDLLTLNNSQVFFHKWVYSGTTNNCNLGHMVGLMVNQEQVQRNNKGEERPFIDLGGAVVNEESIGGN